jgi:hypothetical protein
VANLPAEVGQTKLIVIMQIAACRTMNSTKRLDYIADLECVGCLIFECCRRFTPCIKIKGTGLIRERERERERERAAAAYNFWREHRREPLL